MKKIRIGVFGSGRGSFVAKNFMMLGCEIVAMCDFHMERSAETAKRLGNSVACYDNFDEFIKHDMDAVIIANTFHEHAPYAIKCFERGIHVFSECISNGTMAEGVELIRAFEKSNCIYMLGENYPHRLFNREIKRICEGGTLGKILYAEGEYNHPVDPENLTFVKMYVFNENHWRNYLPRTYYITHSLGPVMWVTGATPKRVTAFAAFAPFPNNAPKADRVGDRVAMITTQNDDGSIFRVTGWSEMGAHHNSCRVCGTNGQIENVRGNDEQVSLRYNPWSLPADKEVSRTYLPEWNDKDENLIKKTDHGGGDFITARMFVECIKENKQPEHPFDIHSAVTMSSVAILGHRSVLDGGKPYDIPDFHEEKWLKMYENDRLTPFLAADGSAPTLPCSSHPDFEPSEEQLRRYRELIKSI